MGILEIENKRCRKGGGRLIKGKIEMMRPMWILWACLFFGCHLYIILVTNVAIITIIAVRFGKVMREERDVSRALTPFLLQRGPLVRYGFCGISVNDDKSRDVCVR